MSAEITEVKESDEVTRAYIILEALTARSASYRILPWPCPTCKRQQRCAPPKVLPHLAARRATKCPYAMST
eukprot:363888-Chlamydomonas_euryale.AAC.5